MWTRYPGVLRRGTGTGDGAGDGAGDGDGAAARRDRREPRRGGDDAAAPGGRDGELEEVFELRGMRCSTLAHVRWLVPSEMVLVCWWQSGNTHVPATTSIG